MTRSLALELGYKKIRCNAICPGFIATTMTTNNFKNISGNNKYGGKSVEEITKEWGNLSVGYSVILSKTLK